MRFTRVTICLFMALFCSTVLSAASPDRVVLQLKWTHQFQFAGYYAAQEMGYFAEEGLNVELRPLDLRYSPIDEVLFAKADYGVQGADLIGAWAEDKPVVSLAVILQRSPLILIARDDITIPAQLKGRRVFLGKHQSLEIIAMLAVNGIPLDSIQVISSVENPLLSFQNGEIDAFFAYLGNEPDQLLQRKIPFNVLQPSRYGIDAYGDCLFTSRMELEQNPERVQRMLRASLKGWRYAQNNPEKVIQWIHSKYNPGLDLDHLHFESQVILEI